MGGCRAVLGVGEQEGYGLGCRATGLLLFPVSGRGVPRRAVQGGVCDGKLMGAIPTRGMGRLLQAVLRGNESAVTWRRRGRSPRRRRPSFVTLEMGEDVF